MGEQAGVGFITRPQPAQRGVFVQALLPFHPFQQPVVELVPDLAHPPFPELVEVIDQAFDQRVQLTGQYLNRFAPLVEFQLPELFPDRRLGSDARGLAIVKRLPLVVNRHTVAASIPPITVVGTFRRAGLQCIGRNARWSVYHITQRFVRRLTFRPSPEHSAYRVM